MSNLIIIFLAVWCPLILVVCRKEKSFIMCCALGVVMSALGLAGCNNKGVSDADAEKVVRNFVDMDFTDYSADVKYSDNTGTASFSVQRSKDTFYAHGEIDYIFGVMFYKGDAEIYANGTGEVLLRTGSESFSGGIIGEDAVRRREAKFTDFRKVEGGITCKSDNDSLCTFLLGDDGVDEVRVSSDDYTLRMTDFDISKQDIPDVSVTQEEEKRDKNEPLYFYLLGELNPVSSEQLGYLLADYQGINNYSDISSIILDWLNTCTYKGFIKKIIGYSEFSRAERQSLKVMLDSGMVTKGVLKDAKLSSKQVIKGGKYGFKRSKD